MKSHCPSCLVSAAGGESGVATKIVNNSNQIREIKKKVRIFEFSKNQWHPVLIKRVSCTCSYASSLRVKISFSFQCITGNDMIKHLNWS